MTDDLFDDEAPAISAGFQRMNRFRGFGKQIGSLYEKLDGQGGYTSAFLVCEYHTNGMMNCQGGMLMAFADTAFGHAVSMKCRDHYWVTVRLLTDFISAAKLGDWVKVRHRSSVSTTISTQHRAASGAPIAPL